jgi:hypothetical protein
MTHQPAIQTKMPERLETNTAEIHAQQAIHDYLLEQFNISNQVFNPELLKTGNEQQQQQQLDIWANGPASIFIQWIPDELATQESAMAFFGKYGKVNRVDIVPKTNTGNKHPGNMAFIHYDSWENADFPQRFVAAYPQHVNMEFSLTNRYGTEKLYILRACINTRPVAQVEFNGPQMVDMMKNLETRVKAELESVKAELERTRQENTALQHRLAIAERSLWEYTSSYSFAEPKSDEYVIDIRGDEAV